MTTKNIRPVQVPITLDKDRIIQFDLNSFIELEDRFGSVNAAFDSLGKESVKSVRFILWAGLIHEEEKLTEKQVGAFVGLQGIGEISDKLSAALTAALPEPKPDAKNA